MRTYLIVMVTVLILAIGCAKQPSKKNQGKEAFESLTHEMTRQEVEAFIGIPFPAEATNLSIAGIRALDTSVSARFDLPREELAAYLKAFNVDEPLELGYTPFISTEASPRLKGVAEWWQLPTDPATFSGLEQWDYQPNRHLRLVVMNPEAAVVTVFMKVFNT